MRIKIGVLGAGVVGLTTALQLQDEFPTAEVVVIAEKFNTETTSDGAAGLFCPFTGFRVGDHQFTKNVVKDSYEYYESLRRDISERTGIFETSGYFLSDLSQDEVENDLIKYVVPEYRNASATERTLNGKTWKYGVYFVTLMIEGRHFLPWALNRFQSKGGKVVQKKISSFNDLAGCSFNAVVNCLGFGAKDVCGDEDLVPIRGQIVKISAPWIKHFYMADDDTYIIPGKNEVTIGGCRHYGSVEQQACKHTKNKILDNCEQLLGGIKSAAVIRDWVGFRPHRVPVRLETEVIVLDNGSKLNVVHNYGHGAQGVTTAPGTSKHAVLLTKQLLQVNKL